MLKEHSIALIVELVRSRSRVLWMFGSIKSHQGF